MSNTISFHRHARRELDRAVRGAFSELAGDLEARSAFASLLGHARERSTLLSAGRDAASRAAAVRALKNLARHHAAHVASAATWAGGDAGVNELIHALAQHVVGRYAVPRGFVSVWLADDPEPQRWFIEHANGRPFREIAGLPVRMTRRMEHILLTSPPHLSLQAAMRRAEILALEGPPELVDTILTTDLAADLGHGDLWRQALRFFARYWDTLGPIRVTTIIDFLYARCVRPTEIATDAGLSIKGPPDPEFSLAGRTPQSLLRIVDAWHAELAVRRGTGRTWPASTLQGFRYAEPPRPEAEEGPTEWWIAELLSSGELVAEGRALRHCVASYEDRCVRGVSSIWSLRRQAGEGAPARRFTIEVDPRARAIVQIRGFANRRADGHPRRIIGMWAERERLTVASHA
ncbi:PcfJ domain-containing protein [Sorangium sp. So ce296]|uniref:PcfJ domain-containing protein n=1 Tax=Sorangium sp. So ce296 TaxID=3133296 RepID=UPI003F5EB8C6